MFIFIFCRGGVPICAELQSKSWRWTFFRCWCYVESCGKNFGWMVACQVHENKISSNVSSTVKHLWAVPFCPHRSREGTNLAVVSVSVFSECWEINSLPNKPSICRSLSHREGHGWSYYSQKPRCHESGDTQAPSKWSSMWQSLGAKK